MFSLPRRQSTSALPSPATSLSNESTPSRKPTSAMLHPLGSSARQPSPVFDGEPASPAPASTKDSAKTSIEMESPVRDDQSDTEDEPVRQHGVSMLRTIRSMHSDSHSELPPRSLSRDFSLSTGTPSTLAHESCSSLKDQFLKIKERFSSPSPPKGSAPATPRTPRVDSPSSSPTEQQSKPFSTENTVKIHTDNANVVAISVETSHIDSDGSTVSPTTTVEAREESVSIQQRQPTRVERWYVEDSYFRGVITCWTIEKGAAIVARIARIASKDGLQSSTSSGRQNSAVGGINPDVTLQWVGRQIWAVTVSLPLTRAGELTEEHIALAHRIDKAIAAEDDGSVDRDGTCHAGGDEQSQTLRCLKKPAERLQDTRETKESASNAPLPSPPSSSLLTKSKTGNAVDTAPIDRVQASDRGEHELKAADDAFEVDEEGKKIFVRTNDSSASASAASSDASVVASLPLSWSMLSLSSLHSSSDNIRNSTTGSTGTCEDDAAVFPRCTTPSKMGWLKKKSGLNSWQARYFELKGNRLYYFANENDGIPRGAVVLEHAHVVRGKGDQAMAFSISSSSALHSLQIIKFTSRLTHQVHARKSIVLRVVEETERAVSEWVTALNRASFYCNLAAATPSPSSSFVYQSRAFPSPSSRKRKTAFSRFRSPSASSASTLTPVPIEEEASSPHMLEGMSVHHLGSVKYLQGTDPLLWEINPIDQLAIRKRASQARTRSDYLSIFSKYAATFAQIYLPRPRPISLEQTLRDILPELFLINDALYGGGDGENNGLENIFEVLDTHIKKFASAQEERVRAVSALLQACARTISGGDSYFVVHSLLGNPSMILRPAEARGHPIEIAVSEQNPSHFLITVFSAFSFHHIDDVENFDEAGSNMTPEPLLRVRTYHIQEFDFSSGKSTRWLRIHTDGAGEDSGGSGGGAAGTSGSSNSGSSSGGGRLNGLRSPWGKYREGAETRIGALLDALS